MLLEGLNQKQQQAVSASLGRTLVLAGAGSGKTRVLVSRIAWLIHHHQLSPYGILAVTFTNKAAGEMKERLNALLKISVLGMWVGTFHGICHKLLRRHYKQAKLPEQFQILDSDDQARMIKRVLAALNLNTEQWPIKQVQHFINNKKDSGLRAHKVPTSAYGPTQTLIQIYQAYELSCQQAGVIDFAEILLKTYELLRDDPELQAHYQTRFQAILVDEFQDTNAIQYALIRLLTNSHTALMVVGDDDQSIYGWRGAKVENIQQFATDFAPVAIMHLEQNYRSTANILDAANALIGHNEDRVGEKKLWTAGDTGEKVTIYAAANELDEARFVAQRIKMQTLPLNEMAILYRSNAQSRVIEEALLRLHIPYRIHGGVRFFERAEIKDALAYLRLILRVSDNDAFERVVNVPPRGIGEKTQDEIRARAKAHACSLWQAAETLLDEQVLSRRAASALKQFLDLINDLQKRTLHNDLADQMHEIIQQSGLQQHFTKAKHDTALSKLDNLQELVNAAKQFQAEPRDEDLPLLTAFLAHASLEAGESQALVDEAHVHLMTLHAAKGLEFGVVFLVGMEEEVFPSKLSLEEPKRLAEERRLCYVGITRAMTKLFLSYAEVRRLYGKEHYHRPSRFLKELPDELTHHLKLAPKPFKFKSSAAPALQPDIGVAIGQKVRHVTFGLGIVLATEGYGAHARVQVSFEQAGAKWLVLAYANLTYIND
tara:strand:+ start:3591 stop:5732 length:2142 start_codon:yes stop_codon:yes gene_type:complete